MYRELKTVRLLTAACVFQQRSSCGLEEGLAVGMRHRESVREKWIISGPQFPPAEAFSGSPLAINPGKSVLSTVTSLFTLSTKHTLFLLDA